MPIYKLRPAAPMDDPAWQLSFYQGEVVVRANSTGQACAIAALEEASIAAGRVPNSTTQVIASAFRNQNLYTVHEDTSGEFRDTGPVRVLKGRFTFPANFTQHDD